MSSAPEREVDVCVVARFGINALAEPANYDRAYARFLPEVSGVGWWEYRHRLEPEDRLDWLADHLVVAQDPEFCWWDQLWKQAEQASGVSFLKQRLGLAGRAVLVDRLAHEEPLVDALAAAFSADQPV